MARHGVGKELPDEAEWRSPARGGQDGKKFTWGNDRLVTMAFGLS